jgi:hypothetical protein
MSRSTKATPPRPFAKEDKVHRKQTHVRYRMTVKTVLARGDFDDVPLFKGTSGWETH